MRMFSTFPDDEIIPMKKNTFSPVLNTKFSLHQSSRLSAANDWLITMVCTIL